MRMPYVLVALAACGSVPQHVPRLGDLPSATCTITGVARPRFDLRYHDTPIARLTEDDERPVIRLTADRHRATAVFDNRSYSYYGDVTLADVRVALAQPVATPAWIEVTRVGIVAIDGDRATIEPVVEPWIHLAATPRLSVPCSALRFADETYDTSSLVTVTPLAGDQTVHLLDAPGGAEVATITLAAGTGTCGAGTVEAYATASSGAAHELRIPTSFGALVGWAEAPKLLPTDIGVAICGASDGYPAYILDSERVCRRDVDLLVADARQTVQVGVVHAGTGISILSDSRGRSELARFTPGKLTPFVRTADIEDCPQRSDLSAH